MKCTSLPRRIRSGFHSLISHVVPVHIRWVFLVFNKESTIGVQSEEICCPFDKQLLCLGKLGKSDITNI